jgi:hypothetical protein
MDPIADFVSRCDAFALRRGWSRSTLSTLLLKDGKRLEQLASGQSDIGARRLEQAKRDLAALEPQAG